MPIAIDPSKPWRYVLQCDLPCDADSRTVWLLRPLTVGQYAKLQDSIAAVDRESGTVRVTSGTQVIEALRLGLAGVERFNDAAGKEVPFTTKFNKTHSLDIVTDDFLNRLHPDWRDELARAITEHNTLSEDDRKN